MGIDKNLILTLLSRPKKAGQAKKDYEMEANVLFKIVFFYSTINFNASTRNPQP